jgi:hypothetical protein
MDKEKTTNDNTDFINQQIQASQEQRIQPPPGHNESIRQQLEHLNNQLLTGAISEDEYSRQFKIIQMSI